MAMRRLVPLGRWEGREISRGEGVEERVKRNLPSCCWDSPGPLMEAILMRKRVRGNGRLIVIGYLTWISLVMLEVGIFKR